MAEPPDIKPDPASFSRKVGETESRKLRTRRRAQRSAWLGFRMFGMVGWSVALPTIAGAFFGRWLDTRYPSPHSWTLTLIILGIVIGSLIGWHWVAKEIKAIRAESEENHE